MALVESERRVLADLLGETSALSIDARGPPTLAALIQAQRQMVVTGAAQRQFSLIDGSRTEANGAAIKAINAARETRAPMQAVQMSPERLHHDRLLQCIKQRGGDSMEQAMSLSPCAVVIESPNQELMRSMALTKGRSIKRPAPLALDALHNKRKKKDATARSASKATKPKKLRLNEARMYQNWHQRKCYGRGCTNKIANSEWFVVLPLKTQVGPKKMVVVNEYGFCLNNDGGCLLNPTQNVTKLMRDSDVRIPSAIGVYARKQTKGEDDLLLDTLASKMPGRQRPFVAGRVTGH